ncbi:hypothetical protein OEZ85_013449 [Tetradesmus obliquus]|uniref:Uncharacterized protein n=1 Tax=Tetradesmus obliquus TaxID=3088 RepID=A0ABY8UU00_TETOB|nr:hypothetical protein OEZ85_013449 [Tetradesmus obliquus]
MELPASWCQAALRLLATGSSSNGAELAEGLCKRGLCMRFEDIVAAARDLRAAQTIQQVWRYGFMLNLASKASQQASHQKRRNCSRASHQPQAHCRRPLS